MLKSVGDIHASGSDVEELWIQCTVQVTICRVEMAFCRIEDTFLPIGHFIEAELQRSITGAETLSPGGDIAR